MSIQLSTHREHTLQSGPLLTIYACQPCSHNQVKCIYGKKYGLLFVSCKAARITAKTNTKNIQENKIKEEIKSY